LEITRSVPPYTGLRRAWPDVLAAELHDASPLIPRAATERMAAALISGFTATPLTIRA